MDRKLQNNPHITLSCDESLTLVHAPCVNSYNKVNSIFFMIIRTVKLIKVNCQPELFFVSTLQTTQSKFQSYADSNKIVSMSALSTLSSSLDFQETNS